jgi:transcriptional regulator with XRE-family HTH domain
MSEEGWLHWVKQTVGELLAAAPTLPVLPRREWTAAAVSTYVDAAMEGNQSECARRLQVHPSSLRAWLQGRQFPHLENLIRICFLLRISPLRLLTGDVTAVATAQQQSPEASAEMEKPKRRMQRFDTKGLREALEAVLQHAEDPPPSMHEVALRLEYDPSHLYKHFPDLCQAISRRYQEHQKAMHEKRLQRTCAEVREAMHRLHEQGCYPSNRQLSKVLPKPAILREPTLKEVWRETLRELGWNQ